MNLERVSPESVGISSRAITDMLDELYRRGIEMHGFMLLRHGKVCAEGSWSPYRPEVQHSMFSFSKSLTSTAIGFARQEGLLSLDEKLVDIFPEKLPEAPSENLKKAEIRHLLMMGCGHETEIQWDSEDWISTFLHHPFVYEPGTHFMYNTAGTNLLSAILTRKTGQTLTQFLRPRLFEPLGMTDIPCHALQDGTEMGGAGCSMTIEDMARFVQFVANRGKWEGRQLLEESWFEEATRKQIENAGAGWDGDPDWQVGYCYQFWRCVPEGVFRGDGAFGQYGVVFTKQDAVLVIQSASMQLQAVLTAVWNNLLPAMQDAPLPEDHRAYHVLQNRLKHLELNPMLSVRNPWAERSMDGTEYVPDQPTPAMTDLIGGAGKFEPDGGRLLSLGFRFQGDDTALLCRQDNGEYELKLGMTGHFELSVVKGVPYGANGCWKAGNQLEVEFRNTRKVTGKRITFTVTEGKLTVNALSTLPEGGLNDDPTPELTFTLSDGKVDTKAKMYWETQEEK